MIRQIFLAAWLLLAPIALVSADARADEPQPSGAEPHDPPSRNRLAEESSPYLLQHAHNPVDWYPWGEEAFEKAAEEDKLIFLSIGYAACHWCHVMERESFMDPEIAAAMNRHLVCVKVDREERPDVDQIYMTAVQLISGGGGGWPMSLFILPDGRPFWGGTYFPARTGDRGNATGFYTILNRVHTAWEEQRESVERQAQALTAAIREHQQQQRQSSGTIELSQSLVEDVAAALQTHFDPDYGGFGYSAAQPQRPKFPEPSNLIFLIDRMKRSSVDAAQRQRAREMLEKTLDGMICGAMFDHLGGGFHRYSVDRRWQIPHFEKMLYDNGQLASVFAAAYAETGKVEYRMVLEQICDFVLREMRAPGGAFYSAIDADSEGEEGKFYRWTAGEIQAWAGVDGFSRFAQVYQLDGEPNFENQYLVPAPKQTLTAIADTAGIELETLLDRLAGPRHAMFTVRSQRPRPRTDDKILTAWNGLMIAGLADAGRVLNRQDYLDAARRAADFVLRELRTDQQRLRRSYARNEARLNAYLDDYSFLAAGLLALFRAAGESRDLDAAEALTDMQIQWFWDEEAGGFYYTSEDHPALIVRTKDPVDSALPSGISVAAENMLQLSAALGDDKYAERLAATLRSQAAVWKQAPAAAPRAAAVLAAHLDR